MLPAGVAGPGAEQQRAAARADLQRGAARVQEAALAGGARGEPGQVPGARRGGDRPAAEEVDHHNHRG